MAINDLPGFVEYKCHKVVRAMHIAAITQRATPFPGFVLADLASNEWVITTEFMERHNPETGGYIVMYEDGYTSFSPKEAFEDGYALLEADEDNSMVLNIDNHGNLVEGMDYADVIRGLKRGESYRRTGWNGAGMHISLQSPDLNSKMTIPYFYMFTADGYLVPWLCSQTDAMATDWCRVAPS